mmetsp:Transcript_10904/g.16262  ORF Transcript_10904/g.16262 Transcript_10904/m.16262 type:complete len:585 (-) Transcript_10904:149-1903(-)
MDEKKDDSHELGSKSPERLSEEDNTGHPKVPPTSLKEERLRTKKKTKLKLKKKDDLKEEMEIMRKRFSTFQEAYNHTLAFYFLKQYIRDRRLTHCFDFINKVDVYKSLQIPTRAAAETAMRALRHIALIQSSVQNLDGSNSDGKAASVAPRNALPVKSVVKALKKDTLTADIFDECYERVKAVLVSFYGPFLRSNHFMRFVQLMEYSKRRVKPHDLASVAHLGQGAFGRVIAVEKRDTHALFAMKEIPKSVLRKHKTGWMCLNEMQLLSRTRSPFVLSLKYSFHSERAVHLVFEMCMGGDLREYLEKAPFNLKRTIFYTAEIMLGINHIHNLEYAYRDLKPSNILLTQTGHCKISDLGLVVKLPKPPKVLKHVAGTPGYWPPEIVARTGTYPQSDFWSLGVLMYAMLSGKKIPDPVREERRKAKKDGTIKNFKKWSPFASNPKEQKVAKADPEMKYIDATVTFPENLTGDAKDLISKLLTVNHKERMGANGIDEIKKHPFFKDINWQKLERLELKPPFKPPKRNLRGRKNKKKNLNFTPVKDDAEEKQFYDGFIYLNEEGFFEEVVDALEDDKKIDPADCCTIS